MTEQLQWKKGIIMFAPTKAREAFNIAEKELGDSIKKYHDARAALQRETGGFIATDKNIPLQFSAATSGEPMSRQQTDC